MSALPDLFVPTRNAIHAVAEHVLGAASYATIGKIGLRANEYGFSTQDLGGRVLTVSGPVLTDGTTSVLLDGSTLRGVAAQFDVDAGMPSTVYTPTTPLELDAPLAVDADCAVMLGEWFAAMQGVLEQLTAEVADAAPTQLWPEHFDLATSFGTAPKAANYGASPGDAAIPEPYCYVGPWDTAWVAENEPKFFFTAEWGTAMPYSELIKASDPLAAAEGFFQRGKRLFV